MLGTVGISTAFAADSNEIEGEFISLGDEISLVSVEMNDEDANVIEDIAEIESIERAIKNADDQIEAQGTGLATVQGEFVAAFPLIFNDGKYQFVDYGYRFSGYTGQTFVRGTLTKEIQDQLIAVAKQGNYEPIGWYILGSIYVEADNPQRFEYYTTTSDGKKFYNKTAKNGSNIFEVLSPYPNDTTESYTYGMEGTVYFITEYPGSPMQGKQATCLLIKFEANGDI